VSKVSKRLIRFVKNDRKGNLNMSLMMKSQESIEPSRIISHTVHPSLATEVIPKGMPQPEEKKSAAKIEVKALAMI
jgi:hypothetical protein